eukprot:scaffold44604_cov46-Cyclotella_meneghiniana.AAC.1
MPSRKKAQGKARRAKQANENEVNGKFRKCTVKFSGGCRHLGEEDHWSQNDWDAANRLLNELVSLYDTQTLHDFYTDDHYMKNVTIVTRNIYHKYRQFDDKVNGARLLFRELILAAGTEICTRAAKKKDLVKERCIGGSLLFYSMIQTIEVRDKYNGAYNERINFEIHYPLNDLECPRETVRFFHRRNSCDCLKNIYYELKETTKRTAACWNCNESVELRQMSRCDGCDVAQYCSYDCAVAYWPKHKEDCKVMRIQGKHKKTAEA